MSAPFDILELGALQEVLRPNMVIAAVRDALIRHARGEVMSPLPIQMLFDNPKGDCHIKAGMFSGSDRFIAKVATGFYDNPGRGLPVNDGLVLVFDSNTGRPQALLRDEGWLTSWRTAAAGALAAEVGNMPKGTILGIVGSGHQARLQAEWTAVHAGIRSIRIFGRSSEKADRLTAELVHAGFDAATVRSIEQLCAECRLIISCTPASQSVIPASAVQPGTHIVALGADSLGKQELDANLFARAGQIFVDSLEQCASHGDLRHAIDKGIITKEETMLLGEALVSRSRPIRPAGLISLVDLTGIVAQDIAIATLALTETRSRQS